MTEGTSTESEARRTLELIKSRRSVRQLDPSRPIPPEWVDMILEAGIWAPSAGNRQPWEFKVVTGSDLIQELGEASFGQAMFQDAPLVIAVIALPERSAGRYGDRGRELYCLQDTAAAVQNMLLLAHALGLGSVWVGAFSEDRAARALGLGSDQRPVALLPMGFPLSDPKPTPRRPAEAVCQHLT